MITFAKKELEKNHEVLLEEINKHGRKYYQTNSTIKVEAFLENNGFSLCAAPAEVNGVLTEKYVPTITFHGSEVGSDRYFQYNDFRPMPLKKAKKEAVKYAMKKFAEHWFEDVMTGKVK